MIPVGPDAEKRATLPTMAYARSADARGRTLDAEEIGSLRDL